MNGLREDRLTLRLCACGREVVVAILPHTGEVVGAEMTLPTPVEEAQLVLAGRRTFDYGFDHEGHSWLTPRTPGGSVRRRLLGLDPDTRPIVVEHSCSAPFTRTEGAPA